MITHEKLIIYQTYNGSNDLWLRMGSKEEHTVLTREDWLFFYRYLDKLALVKQGLLAEQELAQIEEELLGICASQDVAMRLKSIFVQQLKQDKSIFTKVINWLCGKRPD